MEFVTEKQRRYFFWALGKGLIKVSYRRTMTLGRSFTTFRGGAKGAVSQVRATGRSLRADIGTAIPYAQYVVGPADKQAKIHQGHWFRLTEEIEKHLPKVTRILQEAINKLVNSE